MRHGTKRGHALLLSFGVLSPSSGEGLTPLIDEDFVFLGPGFDGRHPDETHGSRTSVVGVVDFDGMALGQDVGRVSTGDGEVLTDRRRRDPLVEPRPREHIVGNRRVRCQSAVGFRRFSHPSRFFRVVRGTAALHEGSGRGNRRGRFREHLKKMAQRFIGERLINLQGIETNAQRLEGGTVPHDGFRLRGDAA